MSRYANKEAKRAGDGSAVFLAQDGAGAWWVGREGDPHLDPIPLGAFVTAKAARQWADHAFPGGEWGSAR